MDKLHKRILQAIPIGSERPRPRREIEQMLGMSNVQLRKLSSDWYFNTVFQ